MNPREDVGDPCVDSRFSLLGTPITKGYNSHLFATGSYDWTSRIANTGVVLGVSGTKHNVVVYSAVVGIVTIYMGTNRHIDDLKTIRLVTWLIVESSQSKNSENIIVMRNASFGVECYRCNIDGLFELQQEIVPENSVVRTVRMKAAFHDCDVETIVFVLVGTEPNAVTFLWVTVSGGEHKVGRDERGSTATPSTVEGKLS
jgi:hypothetical protein